MNRSLALRPENVPARLKLAAHHLKLGEIEAAQEQLEDALLYDPENQQSKRGLAKAYARQGNRLAGMGEIERAVERFNQALLLDSGVPDVHENLGMLQEHLDQPKLAIAHFDRLISLRPEASGGYLRLGRLLVAEGENERARKVLLEGRSVALIQSLHGEVHEFDSLLDIVE
ncbi:MAG: tetratricopeptide repeat protein [Verrucomicrobiota bacterium]